jgi:hypothetical protein
MTRDVYCGSRIQAPDFSHPRIPGSRKHRIPDPKHCEKLMPGWCRMLEGWKLSTCIEPAVFLQTFSWGLQMVVSQDLLIAKTCRLK